MNDEQASAGAPEGGDAAELERITSRLDSLASELESEPDEERAAELVREASELATQAGHEIERALRAAAETKDD